jgi:hypothetical protein
MEDIPTKKSSVCRGNKKGILPTHREFSGCLLGFFRQFAPVFGNGPTGFRRSLS